MPATPTIPNPRSALFLRRRRVLVRIRGDPVRSTRAQARAIATPVAATFHPAGLSARAAVHSDRALACQPAGEFRGRMRTGAERQLLAGGVPHLSRMATAAP